MDDGFFSMSSGLGVSLFLSGLVVITLAWVILRILPRTRSAAQAEIPSSTFQKSGASRDAIILLQAGGRVEYISEQALSLFALREEEPHDLESLARRVRPADEFLDLCAAPGSKRVSIGGRLVDISSFEVPGVYPAMLVSLRERDPLTSTGAEDSSALEILQVATEFSRTLAASLDLKTTVYSILDNVSRLIPSDALELKLWNEEKQSLVSYRFEDTFPRRIATASLSRFGSLTKRLVESRMPLMLSDVGASFATSGESLAIQSYLGIPLLAGGELVGTLEAGQMSSAAFGPHDLNLLQLIGGQAAVALRTARLYEEEQKRVAELAALANLNRALGSVSDMQEVFARLVDSIAPLFQADIIGFLLYDEEKRTLEAKMPFRGLPAAFVEVYRSAVPSGSPAEQLLESRQPILSMNAAMDDNWRALGLTNAAIAASLRDNALIPLVSSGRTLGYLQVGHHTRGISAFTADELRLMNTVANQAAAIIENVLLVQQARARAQRADALRRVASLAGSSATLGEALKYSVRELAHLFQADAGAIYLIDETRGVLELRPESLYGVSGGLNGSFTQIFINDPAYVHTVSSSRKPLLSGRISAERNEQSVYRPLAEALGVVSVIVVPLVAREQSIGELILGSAKTDHFNSYDVQIVSTAAGLLANAVESAALVSQTDESLRWRIELFSALLRISHELGASLDINHLLRVARDESMRALNADCASIFLFESVSEGDDPQVGTVVGCEKKRQLSSIERTALRSGEPQIVDYPMHSVLSAPHEGVGSAIIAPITHQTRALGLMNLHSARHGFFSAQALELVKPLAVQIGIALNNAQRFQAEKQRGELLRRRSETLARVTGVGYDLVHDQPLDHALQIIARGIRDTTPFRVALISVLEPETKMLRRVTAVGIPQETLNELQARKQPLASVQQLMRKEFAISRSYFIPVDQTPLIPTDLHVVTLDVSTPAPHSDNAWDAGDILLVPLENAEGQVIGLISLDDPSNGLRPDKATIETVEVFAAQAALLISNTMRQNELRARLDALSAGLQRQQKLLELTQKDLPILLQKDLEQTIALHNLDRRAQRVRAGLAITESVSCQLDASLALSALGRETLTQLNMSAALIAENTPEGPRLLHVMGSLPRATNVEALFGQRNPLRACLQSGKPILIPNLDENDEWRDASLLTSLRAKGMICLPILVENKPVAAMLALSPEPMSAFTEEDRQVYMQIARQTSLILQNISLLNQTRRRLEEVNLLLDFSRQLAGMDPDAMVRSLLDSARRVLPHAHAGAALLWNSKLELLVPRAVSGYADNESMMRLYYRAGEALPGTAFANKQARRVDEINFVRDYNLGSENLALYRQATGGRLPVSSLLIPIVAGDQPLGLLILDNFNTSSAFKTEDEALVVSLAQQVALSLDNLRLVQATQERAAQLQALNDASVSLTSSLSSDQLINSLLDQLSLIIPYDTATLWLRDKDRLTVASVRGFPDTDQRLGLSVAISDSALFKEMAQTGQPIRVRDVREDPRFPPVETPRLSWLGIPLISKGELIGVIAIEKWQANYYTREQAQVAMTFASQCAISMDNALLYEESVKRATELDQRTQRLMLLNRFASALTGSLDMDQILNLTADELLKGMGAQRVSVVTFERGKAYWKYTVPRTRHKLPKPLPHAPIFDRLRESLGAFSANDARREAELAPLGDLLGEDAGALVILPLASGQNLAALIFAQTSGASRFGFNELEIARTIINQATIAFENARLYQSSVRTAERFALLNESSSRISANLDREEIYRAVHQAAERFMPLDSFVITLLDSEKDMIEPVYLYERGQRYRRDPVPFGEGLSSEVIRTAKPMLVSNRKQLGKLKTLAFGEEEGREVQSIVAVPMILGNKALGMLSAQSYQAGVYTEEDMQILGTLANQAVVAIQNGRLFDEMQKLASQLEQRVMERTAELQREQQNTETLLRILSEVSSSLDLDRALSRTLSLLNEATGAEQGTILLLHPEDNLLHYRVGYGYLSDRSPTDSRGFTLRIGEGLAGWVVQRREAVLIEDLFEDPRWLKSPSAGQEHRSAIAVPLMVGEDVIGVLMVFHRSRGFFSAEMLNLVKAIASQVAVAINNARLYELIRDQAERLGNMYRKEQEDASRSQAILEAVADGVLVTTLDNRIDFINSSAERILNISASEFVGRPLEELGAPASMWVETIRRWSEDPSTIYQPGEMYAEQLELENGRIVVVHLAPVLLQKEFLGTVSIFRDVTHEVEVDRLKSEFVATVSHELRTPMTAIKGYVDILTMGAAGALNENQMHFLDIVRSNIERLNILVSDLLDISRMESGRVMLRTQPLDLHALAEEAIAEVLDRSRAENKPMSLSLDAPRDLPPVLGDSERVRQILSNLLNNSFNYTPHNGTIVVRIRREDGELRVDVQDNGVGIPPEHQERVFDRFFRGDHPLVLATPGTGLGLSIARQLVEMHKGRIWMKSTGIPGDGCTFSFTLPIKK